MNLPSQKPSSAAPGTSGGRLAQKLRRWAIAALLVACLAAAVDGFFIEPYRVEVTHYDIRGPVAAPLKIAQLTDLHTHGLGRRERFVLKVLAEEKPDIIVITGDTLGNQRGDYRWCREIFERLRALNPALGVWTVRGNWENDKPLRHERAFYRDVGVNFLVNSNAPARADVWLAGLDDPYSGTARLDLALAGVPPGVYTIALYHSPAYFDQIAGHVNLCLAGHTHGGQVRLPFIKPFWLPKGCGRFLEGWYEENGSRMYVSRGVGMSVLPIRFLCRPEITFITIHPE